MEQKVLNIFVVVLLVGIVGVSSLTVVQQLSYQNLDAEYQELLSEYGDLETLYEEALEGYATVHGQYLSKVAEYDLLNGTYTVLLSTHSTLIDSLNETMQLLLDTTLELVNLNQTYVDLLADFEELNATYYQLLSEHEILQADYNQLLSDFNMLQEEYNTLLADYAQLQADHDALQSDYDNLWLDYNTLWTAHQTLQNDYDALQANYDVLQSHYNLLQTDYNSLEQDYLSLQDRYSTLLTEYLLLNATYWELWESIQPNYEILVVEYVVPYHTMLYNISVNVIVTLEYIDNGLSVEDGVVIINGYLCSYLGFLGMWNTTIMQSTVGSLVLDNVVYVNSTGSVVDVDQNSQSCSLFWVDALDGYSRNLVVSLVDYNNAYNGSIQIEFTNQQEYHFYGEDTTFSWNVTELVIPEYVLVYTDGVPSIFYDLRYTWRTQSLYGLRYSYSANSWSGMPPYSMSITIIGDNLIDLFDNQTINFYLYDWYPDYTSYVTFWFIHRLYFGFEYFDGSQWITLYIDEVEVNHYVHFGDGTN